MNRFIYFISGVRTVNRDKLKALGLGYVFSDISPEVREVNTGPGGVCGVVVALPVPEGKKANELRYDADENLQTWLPVKSDGTVKYYVGMSNAHRPSPEDLQRKDVLGHYTLPLGDGNAWDIPTAVDYEGNSPLPKERAIDPETGELTRRVKSCFDELRIHGDIAAAVCRGEEKIEINQECEIAISALAINYRVAMPEASLLSLLDDESVGYIFYALCDRTQWPDVADMRKE